MPPNKPAVLVIAPEKFSVTTLAKLAVKAGCRVLAVNISTCVFPEMPHDVSDPKWVAASLSWCATNGDILKDKIATIILWPSKTSDLSKTPPLLIEGKPYEVNIPETMSGYFDYGIPTIIYAEKPQELKDLLGQLWPSTGHEMLTILAWTDIPRLPAWLEAVMDDT
jgi:hypothetical protein